MPIFPELPEPSANLRLPLSPFICWSVAFKLCGSAIIPVELLLALPISGSELDLAKTCSLLYSQFEPPKSSLSLDLSIVQLELS